MLMFGCRHHIADLLVKNVYYTIMKADPSPENQMFKRFRDNFRYVDTSGSVATLEVDNKDVLISFYTDMLLKKKKDGSVFHRDDYREAAKLALILIGGELPEGQMMAYKKPGACHKARFLSSRSSSSATRTLSRRSASAGGRGKERRPGLSSRRRLWAT